MQEVEKGEKLYRGIIENLDSSIAVVDYNGSFVFLNEFGSKQIGWPSGGYIGKTIWDAFPQEVADHHIEFIRAVIETGQRDKVEILTVLQEEPGWFRADLKPFRDEEGKIVAALVILNDIDDLKTTQEKLTRALGWQEAIFEGSQDAIFISDAGARIIGVNRAACELTGFSREQLMRKQIAELHPANVEEEFQGIFNRIMAGETHTKEVKIRKQDGAVVYMEFVSHRVEIDHQYYVHTAGRDITRQKQAELAVRESEERYRLLFETMLLGVVCWDSRGKVVSVNPAACELFGSSPDELGEGRLLDPKNRAFTEEGKEMAEEDYPSMTALKTGKTVPNSCIRFFNPVKQKYCWVIGNAVPLFRPGESTPYGVLSTFLDVTKRKENEDAVRASETKLKTMILAMDDYVLGFDEEGRFVLYHAPNDRPINLGPKETLGHLATEILPSHLAELFRVSFEKNKRKESNGFEFWMENKRETRWYSGKISPIFLDEIFKGSVAVIQDITDRKRAAAEQLENQEKMARAEQLASVGILGATFAHQMNQPLTVIRLFIQQTIRSLEKMKCPAEVTSNLKDSLSEVTKAISITSQFLQYSRRGNQDKCSTINMEDVAKRMVSLLSESARRSRMEITTSSMIELPTLKGNIGEIEQVFFILIQNSIQAAEGREGARLAIRGSFRNELIELEFSDTCGGIAAENEDKIFQPFFTTKAPGMGTGLGLCIMQRIVTKHGGKVRMSNRVGEGVTFSISLPVFN